MPDQVPVCTVNMVKKAKAIYDMSESLKCNKCTALTARAPPASLAIQVDSVSLDQEVN